MNLEAFNVPLREWIAEDRTRREVKRRFRKFLLEFKVSTDERILLARARGMRMTDLAALPPCVWPSPASHAVVVMPMVVLVQDAGGRLVHMDAIQSMCAANLASLEVNYQHLSATFPILAFWLADAPLDMLEIFDEVRGAGPLWSMARAPMAMAAAATLPAASLLWL